MTKFSLAGKWVIMKKQRRILFSLVLMLFLLACSTASTEKGNVLRGKVVRVADGDTVTILVDETQHRIRLDGIDCPELKQAFGRKAKDFVSDLVFGETVKVVYEDTDFYGRILGALPENHKRRYTDCQNQKAFSFFAHFCSMSDY